MKRSIDIHVGLIDDLYQLKNNPFVTLQSVGDKYGLTRERIRQIYNKYFNKKYGAHKSDKECEISCKFDPRNKIQFYKCDNSPTLKKALITENLFIKECRKRRFDISCPISLSTDTVVNGFNVDVKSCFRLFKPREDQNTRYYVYAIKRNEFLVNDFFACYRPDFKKFVIIPNYRHSVKSKSLQIYMLKEKSEAPQAKNRYWNYIDRYDLLIPKPS